MVTVASTTSSGENCTDKRLSQVLLWTRLGFATKLGAQHVWQNVQNDLRQFASLRSVAKVEDD